MAILRRTRAPSIPVAGKTNTFLGIRKMRRVEVKGSPPAYPNEMPHWYVECTTDHDALHRIASAKGLPWSADQLHIVQRY